MYTLGRSANNYSLCPLRQPPILHPRTAHFIASPPPPRTSQNNNTHAHALHSPFVFYPHATRLHPHACTYLASPPGSSTHATRSTPSPSRIHMHCIPPSSFTHKQLAFTLTYADALHSPFVLYPHATRLHPHACTYLASPPWSSTHTQHAARLHPHAYTCLASRSSFTHKQLAFTLAYAHARAHTHIDEWLHTCMLMTSPQARSPMTPHMSAHR